MKRALTFILALSMLLQFGSTAMAARKTVKDGELEYTVLWEEDFDSGKKGQDPFSSSNGVTIEEHDVEHGNSVKVVIEDNMWPRFRKHFDEPVKDGILYVGYNIFRTNKGRTSDDYLEYHDSRWGNGMFIGTLFNNDEGKITWYADMHIDAIKIPAPGNTVPQTNVWHRVESWIDLSNRKATYYIDGEFLGETTITDECTQISSYERGYEGGYGTGIEYVDDYKILHFDEIGREVDLDFVMATPEYLEAPALLEADADVLGYSFYDKKNTINVDVTNLTTKQADGTVYLDITDERGNKVFSQGKKTSIPAKEKKSEAFTFSFREYGSYNVKMRFEMEGRKTSRAETTFMFIKKAPPNETLGYSAHTYWGYGTAELERKQQVLKNAGFTFERSEIFWVYYVMAGYKMDAVQQNILDIQEKNGMKPLVLLAGWGGMSDLTEGEVPLSDKSRENFRKYVSGVANDLKGKVKYYEVFNETHFTSNPEAYVLAQKTAYEAIKEADPEAQVLCGATAHVPEDWIEMLLENGAGEYFDAFSVHPYTIENFPETGGRYGSAEYMVLQCRKLLDKYGLQDKGIVITELSYTAAPSYATETQQGAFGLRQYMMVQPHVESFTWYNDQNKTAAGSDVVEANFGLMRSWAGDGIAYQAKPALLAWAGFNSVLAGAEPLGKVEARDENVWIYKFKTEAGKDVIAVWNSDNLQKSVALKLGAESVNMYDMYGNATTIYSNNGVINLDISENITYLEGNFSEITQVDNEFSVRENSVGLIRGEEFTLRIDKLPAGDVEIKVDLPDNILLKAIENNEIVLESGAEGCESEKIRVNAIVGGKKVYAHEVAVEYIDPVTYNCDVLPYNTRRYQAVLEITNERNTNVSAELVLTEPESVAGKSYKIKTITSGDTRTLRINITPEEASENVLRLRGEINVKGIAGEEVVNVKVDKNVGCLKYDPKKKPEIDGVISSGEWDTFLPMRINNSSMAQQKAWRGMDDLSALVHTMCDDDNLYLAVEVTDDIYCDDAEPVSVWSVDSIQMAIALKRQSGAPSTEIGLGIARGEATIQSYLSQSIDGGVSQVPFSENVKYAVKRYEEEKKTIYELQLPWTDIYAEKPNIATMDKVYFSILVNDEDGNGRGWLEYCGGIGTSKNPELFMELPIYRIK